MKFRKLMSVVLSASLLVGSVPFWGGGKVSAYADSPNLMYENPQGILSVEFGAAYVEPNGNLVHYGGALPTVADGTRWRPNSLDDQIPGKIKLFAFSNSNKFAMNDSGELWAWGGNAGGSLGIAGVESTIPYPTELPTLSSVDKLYSYGDLNAAIKDGVLYGWGNARYDQFGASSNTNIGRPKKITVPGKVKKIGLMTTATLILLEDGRLFFAGRNGNLWKGKGFEYSATYVQVPLTDVENVWLNGGMAVALTSDGKFWGWGDNYLYNAGITEIKNAPADIKSVSMGYDHVVVLTNSGEVYTAGRNDYSQLGFDASVTPLLQEFRKSNRFPANVDYISAGYKNTFLRTKEGKVYGVGFNERSNFGIAGTNTVSYPTELPLLQDKFVVTGSEVTKLSAPSNLQAVTETRSISASWDTVDGAQDYTMNVNGSLVYKGTDNKFVYTNVVPNTTYTVEVFGNKNGTDAGEKATLVVKTKEEIKLESPTALQVDSSEEGNVKLSWTASKDALIYKVVRNGVDIGSVTGTTYTDKTAVLGESYIYSVKAFDGSKTSEPSNIIVVTVTAKAETPKVPTVPTNFNVVSDEHSVTASWAAAEGAVDYRLMVNGTEVYKGPALTYTHTGLTAKTEYRVELSAVNAVGSSSTQLLTITTKDPAKMPAPTNVKAETTSNSATISWDAVEGADRYWVMVNNDQIYDGPELTVVAKNLGADRPYTVYVRAVKEGDTSIITGEQARVFIVTKPEVGLEVPTKPIVENTEEGNVRLTLTPTSDAILYKVLRNGVEIGTTSTNIYVDKTAIAGQTYLYSIKGFDGSKESAASDYVSVVVTDKVKVPVNLDKPSNLVATPKELTVTLTWSQVNGATSYKLLRGDTVIYVGALTTFVDKGLAEGTNYQYSVLAVKNEDVSEPTTVETTTLVRQLAYPANLRITELAYDKVRIDWDEVEGADEYEVTRDGMAVGVPMGTWWIDDEHSITDGSTYTYRVAAIKNGVTGKKAMKVVNVPVKPTPGVAPEGDLVLKATRVQHDRVGLSWSTVTGATYYDVFQDNSNKVWTGPLNAITDNNVGPEESHTYKVVAGNESGVLESNIISVTTPPAPQTIVVAPSEPVEGTITFNYKYVEGAVMYTERNPQTKAVPLGDGTYHITYYNEATGESRDEGIVTPVNGMLTFTESGIDPSKNYHYNISAVVIKPDGTEEVVAKQEVSVTTPSDGSGVTVPGTVVDPTDPGNGGGSTNPGNGGTTNPGNGSGNNGGGSTTPSTGGNTGGSTDGSGSGSVGGSGSTGGSTGSTNGGATTPGTTGTVEGNEGDDASMDVNVPNVNFSDVENNFAKDAIISLAGKGIIKGYTDGTFNPNGKVTRAEFAIMLNRALGNEDASFATEQFVDFNNNAWYARELATALHNGITKGFTDGTYRPDAYIPREQAAVMLSNILLMNGETLNTESDYTDGSNIIAWAKDSVGIVSSAGVMGGYPDGKFMPKRELTRAEAAMMIYNLLSK